MNKTITPKKGLHGTIVIPGDKSISHRSVMFGAIANGITEIKGFLMGADCLSTISCFRKLGIQIDVTEETVTVYGKGLHGLKAPLEILDVGNSGTTLRLLSGILAAQPFSTTLTGDSSIQKRPMDRVALPLKKMGATFLGEKEGKLYAPFAIVGNPLEGISYSLPVASAQVKSAVLLAGLYAKGTTTIVEKEATRNHTEIMLNHLGANIKTEGTTITCTPVAELFAKEITVPGDISSAAYFMVAGSICENASLCLKNVGINPTRTGIYDVLLAMGGNLKIENKRTLCGEAVGDIIVTSAPLKGTVVGGKDIPRLIDEIPVLAVAACFAQGTTIIKDAEELKVKESNRIHTVVTELKKFGANIEETPDGMIIHGGTPLVGCTTESYHDHRIAMSMAIAAFNATGETTITGAECVPVSFPTFFDVLENL